MGLKENFMQALNELLDRPATAAANLTERLLQEDASWYDDQDEQLEYSTTTIEP